LPLLADAPCRLEAVTEAWARELRLNR
jgi:hypothetical protein